MSLCPECQPKVDALEHAIRHVVEGRARDVEWNQCAFSLPDAGRVVRNYKDYCQHHHGTKVKMFTSHQLPIDELKDAIVLWMWERHGIDAKSEDVSFNYRADNNQFWGAVVRTR